MHHRLSAVTQTKITALLEELRTWEPGEHRQTLHQLSSRFELDLFVIDRLARSEGLKIPAGVPPDEPERAPDRASDPNASTIDLDPEKVQEAAMRPDPNPEWSEKDKDTGIWRKKPTGEWEQVNAPDDEG